MTSIEVTFGDRYGLHPRAAFRIQSAAVGFASAISVEPAGGGSSVDARSLMSLVSAGIRAGDRVTVTATGTDEEGAARALADLIGRGVCHP